MTFSEAQLAEYPPQDETALLIDFAAEALARRKFASTGHSGVSWDDWIGTGESREERMEPFEAHASTLNAAGMLSWPTAETPGICWAVDGPGHDRGKDAAPSLNWIQPFSINAKQAIAYFRACHTTGQPCRLTWWFPAEKGLDLA